MVNKAEKSSYAKASEDREIIKEEVKKEVRKEVKEEMKKSILTEFKEFVIKGDIVEIAVGFIIGAGFTTIIQSFIKNIVMPPIGQLLGRANFSNLYINLSSTNYPSLEEAESAGAAVIKYGVFLTDLINFLILAAVVFVVLKFLLKYKFEKKDKK